MKTLPTGYYWVEHNEAGSSLIEPAYWGNEFSVWLAPSGKLFAPKVLGPCARAGILPHCGLFFQHMPDNNHFLVFDTMGILCTAIRPTALAAMIEFETANGLGSLRASLEHSPKTSPGLAAGQLQIIAETIRALEIKRAVHDAIVLGAFAIEDLELDLEELN